MMTRLRIVGAVLLGASLLAGCTAPRDSFDAGGEDAGADAGVVEDGGARPCTDVLRDPQNCGRCGRACPEGDLCVAGECQGSASCVAVGCNAPRTFCDTTTGVCRTGCSVDASCGAGRLCDTSIAQCVPAPSNCLLTVCPAGHFCNSSSGQCQAGCQINADCGPGQTCLGQSCRASTLSCALDPCPQGQYCEAQSLTCREGCDERSPCANGGTCNVAQHTCGARPTRDNCLSTGCPYAQYCDIATGACRRGCSDTSLCAAGQYCDTSSHTCADPPAICPLQGCPYGSFCSDGRCTPGCERPADCGFGWTCDTDARTCRQSLVSCAVSGCAAGQYCHPGTLRCEKGCALDGDCKPSETCDAASAICIPIPIDCQRSGCLSSQKCDSGDGWCKANCAESATCGMGSCDPSTRICVPGCSPRTCLRGSYCDPASDTCVAGCSLPAYPCPEGQTCNNTTHTCVTVAAACSVTCEPGTHCDATTGGRCVPGCDRKSPCPESQLCDLVSDACVQPDTCSSRRKAECDGMCVDLASDAANCGACRRACPTDMPGCSQGRCFDPCPAAGKLACAGGCTDASMDPENCGACGRVCGPQAPECRSGVCTDPCPAQGRTNCGGSCVDTSSDAANCGACGHACGAAGDVCRSGVCVNPCPAQGKVKCDGACVDTTGDPENCGTCGHTCGLGQACVHGQCATCQSGLAACGDTCADLTRDPRNCGACGATCSSGLCGMLLSAPMTIQPALWSFNGNASFDATNSVARLTPDETARVGSIWYTHPITVDTFQVSFSFVAKGGDGFGFVLQQTGPNAVGNAISGLGMSGLRGFGVEFDLWRNPESGCSETAGNEVALDSLTVRCNALPTTIQGSGDLSSLSPPINLADGLPHEATISWSNRSVTVRVDGRTVLSNATATGFTSGEYYFGFTGATGGGRGGQQVWDVRVDFPTARCE